MSYSLYNLRSGGQKVNSPVRERVCQNSNTPTLFLTPKAFDNFSLTA